MNRADIDGFLARMTGTWPHENWTDGRLASWRDILEPLDDGAANRAFVTLRRADERAPSIARFLTTVGPKVSSDSERCGWCNGDGWLPAGHTGLPDGYTAVEPCHCRSRP